MQFICARILHSRLGLGIHTHADSGDMACTCVESWRDTDHVGFLLLSFYVTSLSFIYVFIFFHFTFAANDNKNERVPVRLCADPILYYTLSLFFIRSLMAKAIYVYMLQQQPTNEPIQ